MASDGESSARANAILELSKYRGFSLGDKFTHWLLDQDEHVSRAASLALVTLRPPANISDFTEALGSEHADARANAV